MFKEEQFQRITEEIFFKQGFEFPVTWVMIGVNGAVLVGRFEVSLIRRQFRSVILTSEAKKLRFPINMMVVDRTGKVAHVLFKKSDGPIDLTRLQLGQA